MLPAEELERQILTFVDGQVQGDWRPTSVRGVSNDLHCTNERTLVDALRDLCDNRFLEIRKYSEQLGWPQYGPGGNDLHYFVQREFEARVTHAGRKRFQELNERQAQEQSSERMPALRLLAQENYHEAREQLTEARQDLQKKPIPDVTGAVQHAMAALECTARTMSGLQNETLGQILKKESTRLGIPKVLAQSMEKMWGFASNMARHINEGGSIAFYEAEITVSIAEAMIIYLLRKNKPSLGP
jgi:hypothetical protein